MNEHKSMIVDHPFLTGMKPEHVDILTACAVEKSFAAGEMIFLESGLADRFVFVLDGKISLEIPAHGSASIPVQVITSGEVLGWSWLFPPFRWHFDARAVEPTRVIAFTAAHLLVACERNHDFGYELMKRISQVLIRRLQASRRLLLERSCSPSEPAANASG